MLGSYASLVYAMPVLGGLDRGPIYRHEQSGNIWWAITVGCRSFGNGLRRRSSSSNQLTGFVQRRSVHFLVFYLSSSINRCRRRIPQAQHFHRRGQTVSRWRSTTGFAGFTIFYMGINIGAFTATLLCGWLGEVYGWSWGFGAAGIGMLFGPNCSSSGDKNFWLGHGEPTEHSSAEAAISRACLD